MDSASIRDGEIRIQILKLSIEELVVWVIEQADEVLRQTNNPAYANRFKNDLIARIEYELNPEQRGHLSDAIFNDWSSTDDADGMTRDAYGKPLISLAKASEITGISPDEILQIAKEIPDKVIIGFTPGRHTVHQDIRG